MGRGISMDSGTLLLVIVLGSVIVLAHLGFVLFLAVGGTYYGIRDARRDRAARKEVNKTLARGKSAEGKRAVKRRRAGAT